MTAWTTTSDSLPAMGEYVLIWLPDAPWFDRDDPLERFRAKVARRQENGDPHGNNPEPWEWAEFGPGKHWPSQVPFWAPIEVPD